MTTLFISDLHLDPERPAITELFGRFVEEEARGAEALYILGDLFEAWVGDDDPSESGAFVADRLRALRAAGVPVFFMRGNRDFLLGEDYARRAGMTILPDPAVVVLHGKPTLLTHGDLLCTGDTAYQQFRAQTRDPAWQARFLSQPLPAPIDSMTRDVLALIAAATSPGTTSISAAKAPASSSALTCRQISSALSAVLPTALKPPVQVAFDGMRPTWPQTGMPSSRRRRTVESPAAQ